MHLNNLKNIDFNEKKVLLRADLDVPIINGQIEDDLRLKACFDTLNVLFNSKATVIVIGHLGRPAPQFSIPNSQFLISEENGKFSLQPVADWFGRHYSTQPVKEKLRGFEGWKIKDNLFILENLRFYEGEKKNESEFSKKLASLADIYVNDAFGDSHRFDASIVGIPAFLPHFAGLHLEKEVEVLSRALENPKRPLVVLIGGAKIETKLPLVKKMSLFADHLLVGGLVALELKNLLEQNPNVLGERKANLLIADSTENKKDISEESTKNFAQVLKTGETVIWNGLMGVVEEGFEEGTKVIAESIANSEAYSIVGGGDTVGYLKKLQILDKFSFVSTGGGAMLEFLAGEKLPGIEILKE